MASYAKPLYFYVKYKNQNTKPAKRERFRNRLLEMGIDPDVDVVISADDTTATIGEPGKREGYYRNKRTINWAENVEASRAVEAA